jgi:hypothetical protein
VVCLDCGKQFTYDWKAMKIGKRIESTDSTGVLPPDLPKPRTPRLKWGLAMLPLAVLLSNLLKSKRGDPKNR